MRVESSRCPPTAAPCLGFLHHRVAGVCGIAGAAGFSRPEPVSPPVLARMLGTICHRGPDDEGAFVGPYAALGIRRLSIIDVAGGHQPIGNEDESVWVTLNGEIFNHVELRIRLEDRGHLFKTNADTEVIVHAYEEWGDGCVERLNGQFALALWDAARERLLLARDRVGIKPLHYSYQDGLLVYGSELKALLAHPDVARALDLTALDQYLTYEHVPVPRTIFAGIQKLPPGHLLTLDRAGMAIRQYWDLDLLRSEEGGQRSTAEWEQELRHALGRAVRMELMSDVPLGVFLSGGLDSSTVAALMVQAGARRAQSFAIAFEDESFDESRYARRVADHLGLKHHEQLLTQQMMQDLVPRIAEFLDEPMGDSSIIPTYLLARFARQYVTVALGGDGGDELFAGYSTLQAHRLSGYYRRIPGPLRRGIIEPLVRSLPVSHNNLSFDYKAKRFVASAELPPARRHHLWLGSFGPEQKAGVLSAEVRSAVQADALSVAEEYFERYQCRDEVDRILYTDVKLYLDTDILTKVDRATMASSLEARVPLLNPAVLEVAGRMPLNLKLHRFTRKYLLRRIMKGMLPDDIIARPKKGFNIPVARWFRHELRDLLLQHLSPDRLRSQGLFDPAGVQRLIDDHLEGRSDNRKQLWTLLVFQLWYDRWMAPQPAQAGGRS